MHLDLETTRLRLHILAALLASLVALGALPSVLSASYSLRPDMESPSASGSFLERLLPPASKYEDSAYAIVYQAPPGYKIRVSVSKFFSLSQINLRTTSGVVSNVDGVIKIWDLDAYDEPNSLLNRTRAPLLAVSGSATPSSAVTSATSGVVVGLDYDVRSYVSQGYSVNASTTLNATFEVDYSYVGPASVSAALSPSSIGVLDALLSVTLKLVVAPAVPKPWLSLAPKLRASQASPEEKSPVEIDTAATTCAFDPGLLSSTCSLKTRLSDPAAGLGLLGYLGKLFFVSVTFSPFGVSAASSAATLTLAATGAGASGAVQSLQPSSAPAAGGLSVTLVGSLIGLSGDDVDVLFGSRAVDRAAVQATFLSGASLQLVFPAPPASAVSGSALPNTCEMAVNVSVVSKALKRTTALPQAFLYRFASAQELPPAASAPASGAAGGNSTAYACPEPLRLQAVSSLFFQPAVVVAQVRATCGAKAARDLPLSAFRFEDDNEPLIAGESAVAQMSGIGVRGEVMLLLDVSGSITDFGYLKDLQAAALSFARRAQTVKGASIFITVATFAGDAGITLVCGSVLASQDKDLEQCISRDIVPSTDKSTNLFGAVILGLEKLDETASGFETRPPTVLVVFSDGNDQAGRRTLEEATQKVKASKTAVFTVGIALTAKDKLDHLKALASTEDGFFFTSNYNDLSQSFAAVLSLAVEKVSGFYFFSICSPRRRTEDAPGSSVRSLSVALAGAGGSAAAQSAPAQAPAMFLFDSSSFSGGCTVSTIDADRLRRAACLGRCGRVFSFDCGSCLAPSYPGSFSGNSTANVTCTASCQPGSYVDPAACQCRPCEAGSISTDRNSRACTRCAGGTYASPEGTLCVPCLPGTYATAEGTSDPSVCQACPANQYSPAGATQCSACRPGSFARAGSGRCTPCGPGSARSKGDACPCESCPPGSISPFSGATACAACPVGFYAASYASKACSPCPKGTFSSVEGSATPLDCRACPAGSSAGQGASACSKCPSGSYAPGEGTPDCLPCPAGFSGPEGATSASQCTKCLVETNGASGNPNVSSSARYWNESCPIREDAPCKATQSCGQDFMCSGGVCKRSPAVKMQLLWGRARVELGSAIIVAVEVRSADPSSPLLPPRPDTNQFRIFQTDRQDVSDEEGFTIINGPTSATGRTMVLVDLSGSIAAIPANLAAVQGVLASLFAGAPPLPSLVGLYYFDGGQTIRPLELFTSDRAALARTASASAKLQGGPQGADYDERDLATNLAGALSAACRAVRAEFALVSTRVNAANLILITDGQNSAKRFAMPGGRFACDITVGDKLSSDGSANKTRIALRTVVVPVGEPSAEERERLAGLGAVWGGWSQPGGLDAFLWTAQPYHVFLFGFCSAWRAGDHVLRIALKDHAYAPPVDFSFSANGFGGGCALGNLKSQVCGSLQICEVDSAAGVVCRQDCTPAASYVDGDTTTGPGTPSSTLAWQGLANFLSNKATRNVSLSGSLITFVLDHDFDKFPHSALIPYLRDILGLGKYSAKVRLVSSSRGSVVETILVEDASGASGGARSYVEALVSSLPGNSASSQSLAAWGVLWPLTAVFNFTSALRNASVPIADATFALDLSYFMPYFRGTREAALGTLAGFKELGAVVDALSQISVDLPSVDDSTRNKIIGGVVGGVGGLILLILVAVFICKCGCCGSDGDNKVTFCDA